MDHTNKRQALRHATATSSQRFALTLGLGLGLALGLVALPHASAQGSNAPRQTETKPGLSDAERARRDAEKVSQWIRLVADRSAKATPAPTPAPQPTQRKTVAKTEALAKAPDADTVQGSAIRESVEALPPSQLLLAADNGSDAARTEAPPPPQARPDTDIQLALATPAARPRPVEPAVAVPEVDEVLKPLLQVKPEFPRQLLNTLQGGTVALKFLVKTDGHVDQVQVLSSTHKRLTPAAMAAVQQWRFAPLRREQWAKVELGFQME